MFSLIEKADRFILRALYEMKVRHDIAWRVTWYINSIDFTSSGDVY